MQEQLGRVSYSEEVTGEEAARRRARGRERASRKVKDARASSRQDERPAWHGSCGGPASEVHFPLRDTACTEQVLADGNSDEISVSGDSPHPEWKE